MRKYYFQEHDTAPKVYVTGKMYLGAVLHDHYSIGKNLSGYALPHIIKRHVKRGSLPKDSTGIYLVLTSDDVSEQWKDGDDAMCVDYCGYHMTGNFRDGSIFYYAQVL